MINYGRKLQLYDIISYSNKIGKLNLFIVIKFLSQCNCRLIPLDKKNMKIDFYDSVSITLKNKDYIIITDLLKNNEILLNKYNFVINEYNNKLNLYKKPPVPRNLICIKFMNKTEFNNALEVNWVIEKPFWSNKRTYSYLNEEYLIPTTSNTKYSYQIDLYQFDYDYSINSVKEQFEKILNKNLTDNYYIITVSGLEKISEVKNIKDLRFCSNKMINPLLNKEYFYIESDNSKFNSRSLYKMRNNKSRLFYTLY